MMMMMIYIPNPSNEQDVTYDQFLGEDNRFEFSVYLLLDLLPYQG